MPDSIFPPPGGADEPEFDDRDDARDEDRDIDQPDDPVDDPVDDQPDDPSDDSEDDEEGEHKAVFVSTAIPVQVTVMPLDDERAPEGSALGSYIGDRLVARCAMPREAIDRLMELDLFSDPVPLALLAVEEEPGLQCRLFALVPAERLTEGEDDDEPWKASVPSFEESLEYGDDDEDDDSDDEDDDDEDDDGDSAVASILLGHIVRFQKDRKFAGDLTAEAVDVLQKIVLGGGPLLDANSKAVDDLLDSI